MPDRASLSRPVVVAGPPLVGKTTCGRLAAEILGIRFADLDDLITLAAGKAPGEVILEQGEETFRAFEKRCLAEALAGEGIFVLAVGGGALLDEDSRRLVLSRSHLITLLAPDEVLVARLGPEPRPLAPDESALRALLDSRRSHYLALPGLLRCGDLDAAGCAYLIAQAALRSERGS
jgi:shikimate kinase